MSDFTTDAFAFSYSAAHAASDAFLTSSSLDCAFAYAASAIPTTSVAVSDSSDALTASDTVFGAFLDFGFYAFSFAASNSALALAASASASETDVGSSTFSSFSSSGIKLPQNSLNFKIGTQNDNDG